MTEDTPDSPIPAAHRGGSTRRVTYSECQDCGGEFSTFAEAAKGVCADCESDGGDK